MLKNSKDTFIKYLHDENTYKYLLSFVIIFIFVFVYLYKTTPYYDNVKITITQETANNKLYFDMGYSYKEHFTVVIKKNTAIIPNRLANIKLIDSIAIKDKKGTFIELPFNADHYKSYSTIYIYHQIILSLIIAFIIVYVYFNVKNIIEFVRIHRKPFTFFCLIFFYYATLSQILYPVISLDSVYQFHATTNMTMNAFSLLYGVLATSGHVLFGDVQLLTNIISLFAVSFFILYTCLIAKKIHTIFAVLFAVLIPLFPFILLEVAITERPVVGLWAVTGLTMAIYNAVSEKPNKKIFFVSCFFLTIASMIRYDLVFYFVGVLILYFIPNTGFVKTITLSLIISASVVLFSMGSEKVIAGSVTQLHPYRVSFGTMSILGYLVRDNLLLKKDMNALAKYLNIKKIQSSWKEGDYSVNSAPVVPIYRDKYYPVLVKEIKSKYIQKYPLEYIESRLRFSYQLLRAIMATARHTHDPNLSLARIQQNKIDGGIMGRTFRYIRVFHSDLKEELLNILRKYNYVLVFACLFYFVAISFCFIKKQSFTIFSPVAVVAIFIGPIGKYCVLLSRAPMASFLYAVDLALILFIVIPLCIPFFVHSFKRRKCNVQ